MSKEHGRLILSQFLPVPPQGSWNLIPKDMVREDILNSFYLKKVRFLGPCRAAGSYRLHLLCNLIKKMKLAGSLFLLSAPPCNLNPVVDL